LNFKKKVNIIVLKLDNISDLKQMVDAEEVGFLTGSFLETVRAFLSTILQPEVKQLTLPSSPNPVFDPK
jgi:hypothetical protein